MAVLPIIVAPDARLKSISKPIEEVTDEIRALAKDMLETMYASNGVGLAAIQIGVAKRMLVMDVTWANGRYPQDADFVPTPKPMVLINPEIIEASDEPFTYEEGCLSFPGQFANVTRPKYVKVKYMDLDGKEHIMPCDALLSICVQHEMDHLNGVVFVDYVSKMKRDMILKRLTKQKKLSSDA